MYFVRKFYIVQLIPHNNLINSNFVCGLKEQNFETCNHHYDDLIKQIHSTCTSHPSEWFNVRFALLALQFPSSYFFCKKVVFSGIFKSLRTFLFLSLSIGKYRLFEYLQKSSARQKISVILFSVIISVNTCKYFNWTL